MQDVEFWKYAALRNASQNASPISSSCQLDVGSFGLDPGSVEGVLGDPTACFEELFGRYLGTSFHSRFEDILTSISAG